MRYMYNWSSTRVVSGELYRNIGSSLNLWMVLT